MAEGIDTSWAGGGLAFNQCYSGNVIFDSFNYISVEDFSDAAGDMGKEAKDAGGDLEDLSDSFDDI